MKQGEKLKRLIDSKRVSVLRVSEEVGKSRQFIYNCFSKDVLPSDLKSKVIEIANLPTDYFDVTEETDSDLVSILKEQVADLRRNNEFLQRLLMERIVHIEGMLGKVEAVPDDVRTVPMWPHLRAA